MKHEAYDGISYCMKMVSLWQELDLHFEEDCECMGDFFLVQIDTRK